MSARFMKKGERKTLLSWRKLDKEVDEFIYTWTRWKNWEKFPPIVAIYNNRMVGFHGVSYTQSGYVNSAAQFVLEKYRGKRLAGDMIDFMLKVASKNSMKRMRFRTPHESPGFDCWSGFNVLPFGKCEKDYWFDLDISKVTCVKDLIKLGPKLHLPPTQDKRRIGWYKKGNVEPLYSEWETTLCQ